MLAKPWKSWVIPVVVVALGAGGYYGWSTMNAEGLPEGIASGNGRIEAVEIDISTKTAGRIRDIVANEGDLVKAGQVLAHMDTVQLQAERREADAQLQRAVIGVEADASVVTQREAEKTAAEAVVAQREAELNAALKRLERTEQLVKSSTVSLQVLDDDRASFEGARAAVSAAKAQLAAADAAISTAKAQVVDARASTDAAKATLERIDAEIDDSTLISPRDGRVQYRVAQPGEVLSAGGRVLNLVDLSDVSMTFFLPTEQAGRVALGSEVRIVLDAAPKYLIPASVSFVADVAQFTPKSVETEVEREKLMFRIKARIPQALLAKHIQMVKTGLPGVAYVRLDPAAAWPADISGAVVE